ncbi:hypothetical protein [Actinophytocola algeriensis]|uniref:VCBS repeat-containing protein n=1 Tax=Actinophytocola algeriensis TaxID=1768010 RepID=A0A7W7QDI7_9PSEU|nr:hypothetical protein [Actinophytocola algeriensis]MBB4911523.1 hypothetical protein [Actinophytocola algeriensis]MBE1473489.1 hypothetical protein [Actinophytocola algeriensis]
MNTRTTAILSTGLMTAAALALVSVPAASATPAGDVTTHADLDGDGTDELVTVRAAGTDAQKLLVEVAGEELRAEVPADAEGIVRPPRIVDLNNDGREELAVRERFSSDTHVFGVWEYADGRLRSLSTPNGHQFRLYDGADDTSTYGYGCVEEDDVRSVVVMNASEDDAGTWSGSQVYYSVADGVVTPTGGDITFTALPFVGPALHPDRDTCAA